MMHSSSGRVVRMRTWVVEPVARIRSVAAIPSRRGIITSINTTSGRSRSTRRTASSPSTASPTNLDRLVFLGEDHPKALADDLVVIRDKHACPHAARRFAFRPRGAHNGHIGRLVAGSWERR